MDKLNGWTKTYEVILKQNDPHYRDIIVGIEIVKQFIVENNLIIYGGTAIDYALRLHGDHIYPDDMLLIPDLDMYSDNNIEQSYQLADILYKNGYTEARAINAKHTETMRVDIVDNNFIADLSYKSPAIFKNLPYIVYNNMKIIHPDYQRIDLHSSLSFPYDNAPQEVIFARWCKDIKRFNKIDKYFPIKEIPDVGLKRWPLGEFGYPLTGVIGAHALLNLDYFEAPDHTVELVHWDIEEAAAKLGLQEVQIYESYSNIIPLRLEGVLGGRSFVIYSTKNRLITLAEHPKSITSVQFVLKILLANYYFLKSPHYLNLYARVLAKIKTSKDPQWALSLIVYGTSNINSAQEKLLNRIRHDLDNNIALFKSPVNYYPDKKNKHPEFNYENPLFIDDGRSV